MSMGERLARATNALYERMRDPAAFRVTRETAVPGMLDSLRGHKYGLVVTFRRDGTPVPSAVWMAVAEDGRLYFETPANSWKVKRIRRDHRVVVAPSNIRGRPTGSARLGAARILPREEWSRAETTLASAFGLGRRLYQRLFPMADHVRAYVEVVAVSPASPAPAAETRRST